MVLTTGGTRGSSETEGQDEMNDFVKVPTYKAPEGSDLYSKLYADDEIEVQAERMYDGSTSYTVWLETSANVYELNFSSVNRLNCYLHSKGYYAIAPVKF